MDHLDELDRLLGPVAVMDLEQRGLLPRPGISSSAGEAPGADDRILGALLGAAIGKTVLQHRRRSSTVQLLLEWTECLLAEGKQAAPAFSRKLPAITAGLRLSGEAMPHTLARLAEGAPWHAAAPDSKGNTALLRAVGDGLVWREDAEWRPVSAGLGAVVTHAHPQAVAGAAIVADLIARLVAEPDAFADRHEVVDQVLRANADRGVRLRWREEPGEVRRTVRSSLSAALWFATEHADPVRAMVEAAATNSVVAGLVGAIVGAARGTDAFPMHWRDQVADRAGLEALADRVAGRTAAAPVDERAAAHIWFLVDRSGSMASFGSAVVDGVNRFLDDQRREGNGQARLTLAQFDSQDPFEVVVDGRRIDKVRPLRDFGPRAATPLYDAIGSLIDAAEHREARVDEDHLLVIFTDGLENASRRWTQREIFGRISAKQAEGWTFVFLGTNQDSYGTSEQLGLADGNVSDFAPSPAGYMAASLSVSRATTSWSRKSRAHRMASRDDFFEGRKEAEEAMPKR